MHNTETNSVKFNKKCDTQHNKIYCRKVKNSKLAFFQTLKSLSWGSLES
jgi:hypothetical protein